MWHIPHTTSFISTDRVTEAARAPSDPKWTSKASNTKTGKPRPASTGHFTITPSCLASDHGQPMGFAMYSVISFGIWGCVATRQLAVQPSSSYPGTVTDFRPRDSKSSPKECNRKHSQHERFFSSMFTVPKKGGGWRLIINLKSLNSYLVPGGLSFQNGGHRKPERCVAGRWLHGKDQSRGCLPFSASSSGTSRFLKFCCRQKKMYWFRSLPFSLDTAPRIFTKILRPLVARMRKTGLRIIVYLDDILFMAQSAEMLKSHAGSCPGSCRHWVSSWITRNVFGNQCKQSSFWVS